MELEEPTPDLETYELEDSNIPSPIDNAHTDTDPEQNENENTELPSDVLLALGEPSGSKQIYGDQVHEDIIKIIANILTEGLTKDQKDNLLKTSLIPSNAKLLDAPKLNTELTGIITSSSKSRDNLMEGRQQDLGIATGIILRAIQQMSKNNFDKMNVIKLLGESARLLANLHNQYTHIRRRLISPFLDKTLQQNLKENRRTEFLYSKLEDTVKTTTAMKRAANILKQKPATTGSSSYSSSKNYQHPRYPNQFQYNRTNKRGGAQQPRPRFNPQPPPRPRQELNRQQTSSSRGRGRYP